MFMITKRYSRRTTLPMSKIKYGIKVLINRVHVILLCFKTKRCFPCCKNCTAISSELICLEKTLKCLAKYSAGRPFDDDLIEKLINDYDVCLKYFYKIKKRVLRRNIILCTLYNVNYTIVECFRCNDEPNTPCINVTYYQRPNCRILTPHGNRTRLFAEPKKAGR